MERFHESALGGRIYGNLELIEWKLLPKMREQNGITTILSHHQVNMPISLFASCCRI